MKTVKTHRLTRRQISTVDDIDWKVRIGDPLCESNPIRVRCRVWTWSYQPPSELSLGSPCNGNLDVNIDGNSWKSGLGDGTEKQLVDEIPDLGGVLKPVVDPALGLPFDFQMCGLLRDEDALPADL